MKPLSSSARLRRIVAATVLVAAVLATIGYGVWRHRYSPQKSYQDMVTAFFTGAVALEASDDTHSVSSLTLATQIRPEEPAAWADLGLFYLHHNDLEEAAKALQKARDLAPKNAQIAVMYGLLQKDESHFPEAIAAYKVAIQLDPTSLRAHYELEQVFEQQSGTESTPEALAQFQILDKLAPDNLFAETSLIVSAAKAGNVALIRHVIDQMTAHTSTWDPDAKQAFKDVRRMAAGTDSHAMVTQVITLRNLVSSLPAFKNDRLQIAGDSDKPGEVIGRFLKLPNPPSTPATPDTTLTFSSQSIGVSTPGSWEWVRMVALKPDAVPTLLTANGKEVRVGSVSLPFPGGPKVVAPTQDGIAVYDTDNDRALDLACAGAGGLRLYKQTADGKFVDVTGQAKLPATVLNGSWTGVWAADIDTDGDLDLILGSSSGQPTVLRNNGDGTWKTLHPFGQTNSGLMQFTWADFDGTGSSDAAYLDSLGRLVVQQNKRAGVFTPWPLPTSTGKIVALSTADPDHDGTQDLVVLTEDGTIRQLSRKEDGSGWETADLGHVSSPVTDGSVRLHWADLDNNGAADLLVTSSRSSQVLLGDTQGKLVPLATPLDAGNITMDAQTTKGRLDLIGLDTAGRPVRLTNSGTKEYGWQDIRLAAILTGDQRNNTYGIGSEISLRTGLLYQSQNVTGPLIHFGLGEYKSTDILRILWPNGTPQGEFNLKANQLMEAPQRPIGSCPWLFADDGTGASADEGMKFVTDFIWRSPLGLRINAQDTAGVVQTRDWVKVRGDQLKPRDGFYNLRITADLWETHFFDEVKLMTVDHPAETEVNIDERFSIPPPPLAVNPMTALKPVVRATDDQGHDVTESVRARDGHYLDTFGRGRYQGVTRDHWVTLDLGPHLPSDPLWLVGYGWIHPTDSSINVALGQSHFSPPHDLSLELPDGLGGWKVVRPHLGFPEGKNKTVLISLTGLFPSGLPHQVRLRTNMEIYWDFLGTAQALPHTPLKLQTLAPTEATLRYRGFSEAHPANPSSPELPNYALLAGTSPRWQDLEGYYTRYGDVRGLLAKTDDRYVIMNAGDEIILRFAASPPPPPGWTRDYVLIGDGWVKDGNYNTAFSRTVLPLPSHSRPAYNTPPGRLQDDPVYQAHKQDWVTYQTRWISPQTFRSALRP